MVLLAATLSGTATACTSDRSPAEPEEVDGLVVIRLGADLRFNPSSLTVPAGTTVRWVNDVPMFHTITPDSTAQPGVWTRRVMNARNETFSDTFSQAGETYTYHCEPHLANGMTATVRVQSRPCRSLPHDGARPGGRNKFGPPPVRSQNYNNDESTGEG